MTNTIKDINNAFTDEEECVSRIEILFKKQLTEEDVLEVYLAFISAQQLHNFRARTINDLINILSIECEKLTSASLKLVFKNLFLMISDENSKDFRCVEILPSLIQLIDKQTLSSGDEIEYSRNTFFNELFAISWNNNAIIPLLSSLHEIMLSMSETDKLVEKVFVLLHNVELQEIPPIIYQLLIFSTKGCKKQILEGIMQFFIEKHFNEDGTLNDILLDDQNELSCTPTRGSLDELQMTEATVMLHITFAIKQDLPLGNEFLKIIKNFQNEGIEKLFSPFTFALSCSIASEFKFGDQVYDVLKLGLVSNYKAAGEQQDSKWLRLIMPTQIYDHDCLFKSIKKSMSNCEGAIKGMIRLSFLLMENSASKYKTTEELHDVTSLLNAPYRTYTFGYNLLARLARIHSAVGEEIVKQILNSIAIGSNITLSLGYLDLLSDVLTEYPHLINDNMTQQREIIDCLSFIDHQVARKLIESIVPSIKISATFRDFVILFLRKSLYSREQNIRKVAVNGFLVLLIQYQQFASVLSSQNNSQVLSSSSQIQADLHYRTDIDEDNLLSYEMVGIMKRCMSYRAEVKTIIYRGFRHAIDKNIKLCPPVVEYLTCQLNKFYLEDVNQLPPLSIEKCLPTEEGNNELLEALPELIICLSHCILKWKSILPSDKTQVVIDQIESIFKSIVSRFIQCQPIDFSLEKQTDITLNAQNKGRDWIVSQLASRIYEAIIEITYLTDINNIENLAKVSSLFVSYKRILDYVKERTWNEKATVIKYSYSAEFLQNMLKTLLKNDEGNEEVVSKEFRHHIVLATTAFLKRSCEKDFNEEHVKFATAINAFSLLVKHLFEHLLEKDAAIIKATLQLYLTCISGCLSIIHLKPKAAVKQYYSSLACTSNNKTQPNSIVDPIFQQIQNFQQILMKFINAEEDYSPQIAVLLLQIIEKISQVLIVDSKSMTNISLWYKKLFKENKLDDMLTSKVLTRQLLSASNAVESSRNLHLELAKDLHACFGDIDPEAEESSTVLYASITTKSSSHVCQQLLTSIHNILEHIDCFINIVKVLPSTTELAAEEKDYDLFFNEVFAINSVLFELIQSSIPFGCGLELLVRTLIQYYTTLTNLIKMKIGSRVKMDAPSKYFKKLVKQTHTIFTKALYFMITYIQAIYTDHIRQLADKKKGKKGVQATANISTSKDSKMLPNLIFSIEQYEKYLIQYEKKSKMNLLEHFKLGTARDFRINLLKLNLALDERLEKPLKETQNENEENVEPVAKKSKLNLASKKKKNNDAK